MATKKRRPTGLKTAENMLKYLHNTGEGLYRQEKYVQGGELHDGAYALTRVLKDQGISCSCKSGPLKQGIRTWNCSCKLMKARARR